MVASRVNRTPTGFAVTQSLHSLCAGLEAPATVRAGPAESNAFTSSWLLLLVAVLREAEVR
jgi:hypothetical protein